MEKRINRLRNKSFKKTLLDSPVVNYKSRISLRGNKPKLEIIRKLPKPLTPIKQTPKPKSKPRKPRIQPKRIPSSRPKAPKPKDLKVKKFIDEMTPNHKPEAIEEFSKKHPKLDIVKRRITGLKNRVKSFEVVRRSQKDPSKQFLYTTPGVAKELEDILNRDGGMKVQETLHVSFKKKKIVYSDDGQAEEKDEHKDAYFNSTAFTILNETKIIEALDKAAEEINNKIAEWLSEGSGWIIVEIISHFVNIVKYLPLRGNSYIPTPKELRNSMCGLINLKNIDNECFRWVITDI